MRAGNLPSGVPVQAGGGGTVERRGRSIGATRTYLLLQFVGGLALALVFTTAVLYRLDDAGLDPLQLVLVGTALELAYFAFELPTGVLADAVSRRRMVIAGTAVLGCGAALEASVPTFGVIVAAQVVMALGYALGDGATEAWIADEVGAAAAPEVFLRGSQYALAGTLVGAVASGVVATFSHRLPFVLGGAVLVLLSLALPWLMTEDGFEPSGTASAGSAVRRAGAALTTATGEVVRAGRRHRLIPIALAITFFFGAATEGFDRLGGAVLVDEIVWPTWLGLSDAGLLAGLTVAGTLVGMVVSGVVRSRADGAAPVELATSFTLLTAAWIVVVAVLGLTGNLAAAAVCFAIAMGVRPALSALLNGWLVGVVPSHVRATTFSVAEMSNAVGQMGGGPVIGAVATARSIGVGLQAAAVAALPVIALVDRARRHLAGVDPQADLPDGG